MQNCCMCNTCIYAVNYSSTAGACSTFRLYCMRMPGRGEACMRICINLKL